MFYEYLGEGANNTSRYKISLKLYLDCGATSPGQLDPTVNITIFDKGTFQAIRTVSAQLASENFLRFDPASNPCIGNPPLDVCYRVRTYSIELALPNNTDGYTLAFQRCCRIINIQNLMAPSNSYGATYTTDIPGTDVVPDGFKNSGPTFNTKDDANAICRNSNFTFSFAATQPDPEDRLVYRLCSGYIGASQNEPSPATSSNPPYTNLSYNAGFSGGSPLGPTVTIDSITGIISGVAPERIGQYVITACAYEYRDNKLINVHRKDIHIAVSDCVPLQALLKPNYSFCDDFNVSFSNLQVNPPGSVYTWDFGDGSDPVVTTDPMGRIQHRYADAGSYTVKVKVVLQGQCEDETTAIANVYPGFFPGFTAIGSCLYTPFEFRDTTKTRFGVVSKWNWNFGDETTLADSGKAKNHDYLYNSLGLKRVQFIVESDKGCIDTVYQDIEVRDRPLMSLPFRDTLICSIDSLRLGIIGNGIISWSPNVFIDNPNTANPWVFPKTTTTYRVNLNENGCVSSDSILVRVVDFVTLNAGPDTTICAGDSVFLTPSGNGLQYSWSPSNVIADPLLRNPLVFPATSTVFRVDASIGKCTASDVIRVNTVPYPIADAGNDTIICYNTPALLKGAITASRFTWSPTASLQNASTLQPLALPEQSTVYTLTVYDTLGCPKPAFDTVRITVREKITAFAGNDTAIVAGQPLLLSGTGAELFRWDPPLHLDMPDSRTPTALLDNDMTYTLRAFTAEGCFSVDTINIRVFKTQPDIFVPNAFTPDGFNKVLKPITPGIERLHYFRIYNRWGQLVFSTTESGPGWDGRHQGKLQDSGTYVWMVSGTDFTGKVITRKGTSILIR